MSSPPMHGDRITSFRQYVDRYGTPERASLPEKAQSAESEEAASLKRSIAEFQQRLRSLLRRE